MKDATTRKAGNKHDTREGWLRAATDALRPYFVENGYPLPYKIRHSIGFPSTGKHGKRRGELWHSVTSADDTYELFIRADLDNPAEVLGVLVHELVHSVLPLDAGHGKLYKEAAAKIGLTGPMRHAMPNPLLADKLQAVADDLGPLPHAMLYLERGRDNSGLVAGPKKQKARLLKAECTSDGCGFNVRIVAKWVSEVGPPHCPKHGEMRLDTPPADIEDEADADAATASHDMREDTLETV